MTALATQPSSPSLARIREAFEQRVRGEDPLAQWRRAALERFLALGFPTQRDERWKYTNLRRLEMRNFAPAEPPRAASALSGMLTDASLQVVLVDGHCMPSLSHGAQPPGLTVIGLGQWLKHAPAEVAGYLSRLGPHPANAFENLNAAFFDDGLVIDVAAGTHWDEPIYVVHAWQTNGRMAHPRIVVRLGENSRCTLIEHYIGTPQAESFTNAVVTVEAQPGACLKHYRLQQEPVKTFHIATVRARLAKDARYFGHEIALGAALGRADITGLLEGPGAELKLRGLFTPTGSQHLDTYTRIEHVAPNTNSEEEFRGIADGRGRGVFNGKVKVHPNAQRIDARQLSRNLLLSPTAEIDTKPELEIYANDVKCSHGATTGQLDATALFYLRSRGIDSETARALLIRAFAESILTSIETRELRTMLEDWLMQRFARTEA
jgi:Fe-S cluster assembly protein SufD